jgi:hypothetical protein
MLIPPRLERRLPHLDFTSEGMSPLDSTGRKKLPPATAMGVEDDEEEEDEPEDAEDRNEEDGGEEDQGNFIVDEDEDDVAEAGGEEDEDAGDHPAGRVDTSRHLQAEDDEDDDDDDEMPEYEKGMDD